MRCRGGAYFSHMQAYAIIGKSHETRHGNMVDVGAMVPPLFFDAECSRRGVKSLSAGADGEIHGWLSVDEERAALLRQIDFDMFFSCGAHQRFIDNDVKMRVGAR